MIHHQRHKGDNNNSGLGLLNVCREHEQEGFATTSGENNQEIFFGLEDIKDSFGLLRTLEGGSWRLEERLELVTKGFG